MPYYVSGEDVISGGSGILEWCFDWEDANQVMKDMQASQEFSLLSIGKTAG